MKEEEETCYKGDISPLESVIPNLLLVGCYRTLLLVSNIFCFG